MGHARKASDSPSPLQLLAIFAAKETGMPIPEIAARTKYAKSSIIRWWQKWGQEMAFYEAVRCECPAVLKEYSFDVWWPKERKKYKPREANPLPPPSHLSVVSDNTGI